MSAKEKNRFGGLNPLGLYVPMSEIEQEAWERLIQKSELEVIIAGWGTVHEPKITLGDKRVGIHIDITFNLPLQPVDVYYFDFELRTRSGLIMFSERHAAIYDNKPIKVGAGIRLQMVWEIAVARMDPKLIKMLMPGTIGLTSRLTDKDTGEQTLTGNMKLSSEDKKAAFELHGQERKVKQINKDEVSRAKKMEKAPKQK